jgi:hypothetical protein
MAKQLDERWQNSKSLQQQKLKRRVFVACGEYLKLFPGDCSPWLLKMVGDAAKAAMEESAAKPR